MKKSSLSLLLLCAGFLATTQASAQQSIALPPNAHNPGKLPTSAVAFPASPPTPGPYCVVAISPIPSSNKVAIAVDNGQETQFYGVSTAKKDVDTGKVRIFDSIAQALNSLYEQGWEFESAYAVPLGHQTLFHYVLRRHAP